MRDTFARWSLALTLFTWTITAPTAGAAPITANGFRDSELPDIARPVWEATVLLETRIWGGGPAGLASTYSDVSTGSGLIIDRQGRTVWIVTSSHVVRCPATCRVRVHLPRQGAGQVSAVAELMWSDPRRDLALLRATAPRKAVVRVAHVAPPSPGIGCRSGVLAIGFPDLSTLADPPRRIELRKLYSIGRLRGQLTDLGADYQTYGSARIEGRLELDRALTHDADLLPGSSGGPLIDACGRVLGINTGSLTVRGDGSCAERRERCRMHLAVPIGDLLLHEAAMADAPFEPDRSQ